MQKKKKKKKKKGKKDLEVSPLAFYIDTATTGTLCMVKYAHNFHYALGKWCFTTIFLPYSVFIIIRWWVL